MGITYSEFLDHEKRINAVEEIIGRLLNNPDIAKIVGIETEEKKK